MADKSVEFRCLEKIINAPRPRGRIAKDIYAYIQDAVIVSDETQERPDFILCSDSNVIGIEHFLVDVLSTIDGSNARRVGKKRAQLLKNTKMKRSHRNLKRINKNPIVQEQLQAGAMAFDERRFLREFHRIAYKHNESVEGYKYNLQSYKRPCIMGAIIEMPCQTSGIFKLYDSSGTMKERMLNCVPLTYNLISIIKRTLKNFDFVIILTETLLNETPRDSKVYCFTCNNIDQAIKEQRIPICSSFTLKEDLYEN